MNRVFVLMKGEWYRQVLVSVFDTWDKAEEYANYYQFKNYKIYNCNVN